MERREALRESDMDVVGGLFALRFIERNLVELYVEDDEWYHFKATFNKHWLVDLGHVAAEGTAVAANQD
jgi:hypothetical protein